MPIQNSNSPYRDPLQSNVHRIGRSLDQFIDLALANGTSFADAELAKTCQVVIELGLLFGESDPDFNG